MKKTSSAVWKFFERIEDNGRCVAVLCKLCESQYKFFGNTTNLRVHLANKHPIQWEMSLNGTLDESTIRFDSTAEPTPRKKRGRRSVNKNVDILQNSDDSDNDQETLHMVRQMHGDQSGEEWLEDDPYQITHFETYEPKPKRRKMKYHKIKREVTSPTDLPGFYVAPKSKPIYEESTKKDEYSIFGEYIANKLRKLQAPKTRGNIQQLITTIMWQAEYGMYDNVDAVRRVLMMSINEPQSTPDTVVFEPQELQAQVIEQEEVVNQSTEGVEVIDN